VTKVVDQHGIQWKKEEIIDNFPLSNKQLKNTPNAHYKKILDAPKNIQEENTLKKKLG